MARVLGGEEVPSVSPAGDPGLNVSPVSFGYSIGPALEDLGSVLNRLGVERADQNNGAWVVETVAKTRRLINDRRRTAEAAAEPGAPNYTQNLTTDVDSIITAALEGAPSERAKLTAQGELFGFRDSVIDRAADFEATERSVHTRATVAESIDILSSELLEEPDRFGEILDTAVASLNVLTPREKERLQPAVEAQVTSSYLTSLIKQDPEAARDQLVSGGLAPYLSGKDAEWLDRAETEIARRAAEAERASEAEMALLRADVERQFDDWETDARINGVLDPSTENQIETAYSDPAHVEQGQRLIAYLQRQQSFHGTEREVALATQERASEILSQYWPSGTHAKEEAKNYTDLAQALENRDEAMREDPKSWILRWSPEARTVWEAAGDDPTKIDAAVKLTDQIAMDMGYVPRILSEPEAKGVVAAISVLPPPEVKKQLLELRAKYGNHWGRVSAELEDKDLPAVAQVIDFTWHDPLWQDHFIRAMQVGEEALRDTLRGKGDRFKSSIEESVRDKMHDLLSTIPDPTAFNTLLNAALLVAYDAGRSTDSSSEAAEIGVRALVGSYRIEDVNGHSYRIPASAPDVSDAVDRLFETLDQYSFQADSSTNPALDESFIHREMIRSLESSGYLVTDSQDKGVLLVDEHGQPVIYSTGEPAYFTWEQLLQLQGDRPAFPPPGAREVGIDSDFYRDLRERQSIPPGSTPTTIENLIEGSSAGDERGGSAGDDLRQTLDSLGYDVRGTFNPYAPFERLSTEDPTSLAPLQYQSDMRTPNMGVLVKGMIEPGNINLFNRPRVQNDDGSISTLRSVSFNFDGVEVLIPTVSDDGRLLSDEEAIKLYKETGRHLGKFQTPETATEFARTLSSDQDKLLGDPRFEFVRAGADRRILRDPRTVARERDLGGLDYRSAGADRRRFISLPVPEPKPAMAIPEPKPVPRTERMAVPQPKPQAFMAVPKPKPYPRAITLAVPRAKPPAMPEPPVRPGSKAAISLPPTYERGDLFPMNADVSELMVSVNERSGLTERVPRLLRFASSEELGQLVNLGLEPQVEDEMAWRENFARQVRTLSDQDFARLQHEAIISKEQVLDVAQGGVFVEHTHWADGSMSVNPGRGSPFGEIISQEAERRGVTDTKPVLTSDLATEKLVRSSTSSRLELMTKDPQATAKFKEVSSAESDWRKTFANYLTQLNDDQLSWLAGLTELSGQPKWVMPVSSGIIRDDPRGHGVFKSSRKDRLHEGVDLVVEPGEPVYAPVSGTVTYIGYVYDGDTYHRYAEIFSPDQTNTRVLYISPSLKVGTAVTAGSSVLGFAQDVSQKWGSDMLPHIELQVRMNGRPKSKAGQLVNPWPLLLKGGGDMGVLELVTQEIIKRPQLASR